MCVSVRSSYSDRQRVTSDWNAASFSAKHTAAAHCMLSTTYYLSYYSP